MPALCRGPGPGGRKTHADLKLRVQKKPTQADQSPEMDQPPLQPGGESTLSEPREGDPRPGFSPSDPFCHHQVSHWLGEGTPRTLP